MVPDNAAVLLGLNAAQASWLFYGKWVPSTWDEEKERNREFEDGTKEEAVKAIRDMVAAGGIPSEMGQ
jgi:hypothetical protein